MLEPLVFLRPLIGVHPISGVILLRSQPLGAIKRNERTAMFGSVWREYAHVVSRHRRSRGERRAAPSGRLAGATPDTRAARGSSPSALGCRGLSSPLPDEQK